MHWAEVIARKLAERDQRQVIATGITPSGPIHVGNMREVLTGDAIHRCLKELEVDCELVFVGDTFDPLRKVYPFLDDSYSEHVGRPLSAIPCPCDEHDSYATHFLAPFLEVLERLGIEARVVKAHELYASGAYGKGAARVLELAPNIAEVLGRVSGRELADGWVPYNPLCQACGRISGVEVTSRENELVAYHCQCGHEGQADPTKGEGKLPWRVDWPTRWHFLGVTMEPFGKDHAAAGGSYDTGSELVRMLYDREPPEPLVYEWIQLKSGGKAAPMSSSTGVTVAATEMLAITPPEVLRWLIMRVQPQRHIDFDPGLPLLDLVDDYDRAEAEYFTGKEAMEENRAKAYELSQPRALPSEAPVPLPFRHLVTLTQSKPDFSAIVAALSRTEHFETGSLTEQQSRRLEARVVCVKEWLKAYAPEGVRFTIQDESPDLELSPEAKNGLSALVETLEALSHDDWVPENLHNAFYQAGEQAGMKANKLFKVTYQALLDKSRGPRLGFFLATLERDWVVKRLRGYI